MQPNQHAQNSNHPLDDLFDLEQDPASPAHDSAESPPSFQLDSLESRILMSATCMSADLIEQLSQIEELTTDPQSDNSLFTDDDLLDWFDCESDGEVTSAPNAPRSVDGSGNNSLNPEWGQASTNLLRLVSAEYGDGSASPTGADRPSARGISNEIFAQSNNEFSERGLSDMVWLWGQFIDHDLSLTETNESGESLNIEVPQGDRFFDPEATGEAEIKLDRSNFDEVHELDQPRQQTNEITSFIDGSMIYGSDEERASAVREFEGGRLSTSEGELLPFNSPGLANAGGERADLFLAGDVRANENAALTAMHTIWVREHNHWADRFAAENPTWSDEEIFQKARAIVAAEIQAITYNEFLPALLGTESISEYAGYDVDVNPSVANEFSTAAFRLGHSMLPTDLRLVSDTDGATANDFLPLRDAFFAVSEVTPTGIESILVGAAEQIAQEVDTFVVDDIRNFLFGPPGSGGFDLVSLNIQRGRDHGLPDYNQTRVELGLDPVRAFSDITSDHALATSLEELYGDTDNIDLWVGGLAEDHIKGASVGEVFHTIIVDQFERLRSGDRYWYQAVFDDQDVWKISQTTLTEVIERNSNANLQDSDIFFV